MIVQASQPKITELINEVYASEGGSTVKIDREAFEPFIRTTVNGDQLLQFLVVIAQIDEKRMGIILYLLTNSRLVKIEVDGKGFQSTSTFLKQLVGVNRSLNSEKNEGDVRVSFPGGMYGLRYPADATHVIGFFEAVEAEAQRCRVG